MTYKELGKYETIDYIETAKQLASLNYVDKNNYLSKSDLKQLPFVEWYLHLHNIF